MEMQLATEHEKEWDGLWRVFNGAEWKFGFTTKEAAIELGRRLNGTAVGLAEFDEVIGANQYRHVSRI